MSFILSVFRVDLTICSSRPIINLTSFFLSRFFIFSEVHAFCPSRRTVTSSQILNTSSSLWLTKTMLTPSSRTIFLSNENRFSASLGEREEVGSSNKRIFALRDKALAISQSCILATVSSDTTVFGSMSRSIISSHFFD